MAASIITREAYGVSLDDAYIFFVYARNLAAGHGWSFNPGHTSFGTSSVLWTLMLSLSSVFKIDLIQASRILSSLLHAAAAVTGALILRRLTASAWISILGGVAIATSPSLLRISQSGMDVSLHIFLFLIIVMIYIHCGMHRPRLLGVLLGLAYLSRPDAVIIPPLLFAAWFVSEWRCSRDLRRVVSENLNKWLELTLSAAVVVLPWQLFILLNTGKILPTTHYAKLLSMGGAPETLDYSLWTRTVVAFEYAARGLSWILSENGYLISGGLVVVAILFTVARWLATASRSDGHEVINRHTEVSGTLLCILILLILPFEYGWKTPWWYGGYLHRYILPVLPIAIILSCTGLHFVLTRTGLIKTTAEDPGDLLVSSVPRWASSSVNVLIVILIAATVVTLFTDKLPPIVRAYKTEVGFNEGYRRAVAEWISSNTPTDARIGACFLGTGAIGYYANRFVVDSGGLVAPEIIEFWARDGNPRVSWKETLEFFASQGVTHLVASPEMAASMARTSTEVARIRNTFGNLTAQGKNLNEAYVIELHHATANHQPTP